MINMKEIIEAKINVVLNLVNRNIYPKEWRKGQAIFNIMYFEFPNECNILRGTEFDCFFSSEKCTIFLTKLQEILLQNVKSMEDIQQEAFEASRLLNGKFNDYLLTQNDIKESLEANLQYNTFEDYLKSKENEK